MISKRIDRLVEWTKWPTAFLAIFTLPLTAYAWWMLVSQVPTYPGYAVMFAIGIGFFVFLARSSLAQTVFARRIVELERDLTQSILAFSMLHPVIGYGANRAKGSRVRWLGRGNWLMLAAPYFVPTATILLWLVSLMLFSSLRCLVLGFGISYHLTAVAIQCQTGTSEVRRLGRKFCWMFLPAANMIVAGLVAAYSLNGFTGMGDFVYDWFGLPRALIGMLWKLFFAGKTSA